MQLRIFARMSASAMRSLSECKYDEKQQRKQEEKRKTNGSMRYMVRTSGGKTWIVESLRDIRRGHMEADIAECITERKQLDVSLPDTPQQWSDPDGWPFSKANSRRHCSVHVQKPVEIDLDPLAEEYDMNHERRGVALILNHVHFESMNTRQGSVKDSLDLKASLSKLGFDVRIYTDPTVKAITATLQSTAAEDHTDADCLIVVAMSHGESGLLHSTDSLYPVDMLWTPFTGDQCSTLAGKPKLFFIQACRGSQLDKGVKIIHETDSKRTTYSIPAYADIMVAYSTYDGFFSWRNPDVGSWFIQALCEELDLHGRKRDLLSLMTSVNRRVAIEYQSYVPQNEKFHGKKQIPSIVSMLTRLVYFPDKCASIPDDPDDVSEEKKSQVCEKVTQGTKERSRFSKAKENDGFPVRN